MDLIYVSFCLSACFVISITIYTFFKFCDARLSILKCFTEVITMKLFDQIHQKNIRFDRNGINIHSNKALSFVSRWSHLWCESRRFAIGHDVIGWFGLNRWNETFWIERFCFQYSTQESKEKKKIYFDCFHCLVKTKKELKCPFGWLGKLTFSFSRPAPQ